LPVKSHGDFFLRAVSQNNCDFVHGVFRCGLAPCRPAMNYALVHKKLC
jgi:hypothetical protein